MYSCARETKHFICTQKTEIINKKVVPSVRKVMLTFLGHICLSIFKSLLKSAIPSCTVQFCKCVRDSICRKQPGLLRRRLLLLQGNDRLNVMHKFEWKLYDHLPYSLVVTLSSFHLFGKLTEYLDGQAEVECEVWYHYDSSQHSLRQLVF